MVDPFPLGQLKKKKHKVVSYYFSIMYKFN